MILVELLIYILSETLWKWWHPHCTLLRFWQNFIYCSCLQQSLSWIWIVKFILTSLSQALLIWIPRSSLVSSSVQHFCIKESNPPKGLICDWVDWSQFNPRCCCLISCYRHYLLAISLFQIWLWEQLLSRPVITIKARSRISIENLFRNKHHFMHWNNDTMQFNLFSKL